MGIDCQPIVNLAFLHMNSRGVNWFVTRAKFFLGDERVRADDSVLKSCSESVLVDNNQKTKGAFE